MPTARDSIIAILYGLPVLLLLSRESCALVPSSAGIAASSQSVELSLDNPSATRDTTHTSGRPENDNNKLPVDSVGVSLPSDTLTAPRNDTIDAPPFGRPDTGIPPDELVDPRGPAPDVPEVPGETGQPDRQGEVRFSSSDSLVFSNRDERRATLYGNARVGNESGELTAGMVLLNLDKNEMSAETATPEDTLSEPVLQRGQDRIRSRRIMYNYETDKGKFDVARLSMSQGNVIGTQVKRTAPHVIFVEDGIYSTCDLDHPHFYIRASRMKVVDEEEIFFTRARLYILDIPYPLVFPFGYVPGSIRREQSGILEPSFTYQDQQRRGLGIQNLGWFQYINEYLTAQASMDIFTSGTYYVNSQMNYARTDHYSGSLQYSYSRDRGMEQTDPDFFTTVNQNFRLNHRQTINPYSSMTANINLRTADFHDRNSYEIDDRAEVSTNSRASYNYNHPEGSYTFSISGHHSQNFQTNATTLSGPDLNFSMRQITPFQRTGPATESSWYESFSLRYRSNIQSRYRFNPITTDTEETDIGFLEALFSPSKHREATGGFRHIDTGMRHNASMSVQLLSSAFANLNSSFDITEYWYPQTLRREWDEEEEQVISRMESGFTAGRDFSTSVSANTAIYGISDARIGRFQGFRHTMRPSLSFSYSPDFSDPFWGVFRDVQINPAGDTQRYSIFQGGIVGGPSAGRSQTMSLSINNVLEAREVRRDTTGERSVNTIQLIDRFNLSTSYNFAADRFNLSDLTTSLVTSYLLGLNLSFNATFSFYDTDEDGNRIDRYLWEESNRLMRLTNFRVQTSTSFSGGGGSVRGGQRRTDWHHPENYDPFDQSRFHPVDPGIYDGRIHPVDVPWSVDLNFSYNWRLQGNDVIQRAVLNARNIQIRLTPEWQFRTQLGYDFIQNELTPAQFNINRNLHCWNLSFQWNPFGDRKYFLFRLSVSDSRLHGLFQKLPGLNNLERSSTDIGRMPRSF